MLKNHDIKSKSVKIVNLEHEFDNNRMFFYSINHPKVGCLIKESLTNQHGIFTYRKLNPQLL